MAIGIESASSPCPKKRQVCLKSGQQLPILKATIQFVRANIPAYTFMKSGMWKQIGILMLSVASAQAGLSKLEAISMIETADRDAIVGRAGERSRYQIMPAVWKSYTGSRDYANPEVARTIAERHLTMLEETYRKATGREPSNFDLYVLWNAGPTYYAKVGFDPQRVSRVVRERAQRYVNLREMKQHLAPTPLLAFGSLR